MKKVLITGGAGFIGYHLAKNLLTKDYEVHLLDDFSRAVMDDPLKEILSKKNISLINIDILNKNKLNKINRDYHLIFHLAAVIGVQHVLKSPYDVLTKNFKLLENVILLAKNQTNLDRFVFTSTSEVYSGTLANYGLKFPTPESTILSTHSLSDARSSYMLSKIYGEALCFSSGLPVTIIRPHNFYGPRMGLSHVIPELMNKIVKTKNGGVDVFSVEHKRTFCYIKDAVEMIILLVESKKSIGQFYNIGNDHEEIKMGDLGKLIIDIVSKGININSVDTNNGSPERRCPDMGKFNKIVNYKQTYSLSEGIEETFAWYGKYIFSNDGVTAI